MRFWFSGPRIFGIRPGISLSPSDFRQSRPRIVSKNIGGAFVYAISGQSMIKIGVTTNPSARISSLRTASPFPLDFAFIGITPGSGFDIEKEAHSLLAKYRCEGEWFDCSPELAIAGIMGAAASLGHPLKTCDEAMANRVLQANATGTDPVTRKRVEDLGTSNKTNHQWVVKYLYAVMVALILISAFL